MFDLNLRKMAFALSVIIVVYAALFFLLGTDRLVSTITRSDRKFLLLLFCAIFGWLAAWGMALRTVLGELNISISPQKGFLLLTGVMFFNNITPFGQAGGEPFTAHLISRITDSEYETGLATIISVDTLNFVPSISLALFGVCYFLLTSTLSGSLEIAAMFVVVLAVAIPSLLIVSWRQRDGLEQFIVNRLTPVLKTITQHVSWVSTPTESNIRHRVDRFFRSIEHVTSSRRSLACSLGYSTLGWVLQVVGLWVAFRAINHSIPFAVALFVVPIAAIAGVTPLPGGTGAIEGVLIALLIVVVPALGVQVVSSAVIIFRGIIYWIPILLGGTVTSFYSMCDLGS